MVSSLSYEERVKQALDVYRLCHVVNRHRATMRIFRKTELGSIQVHAFVLGEQRWMALGEIWDFYGTRELALKRYNYLRPREHVVHRDLVRASDESAYRSLCPECGDGLLLMQRDQVELTLLREDMCVRCWSRFWYLDDEINGEKLHG